VSWKQWKFKARRDEPEYALKKILSEVHSYGIIVLRDWVKEGGVILCEATIRRNRDHALPLSCAFSLTASRPVPHECL
jgi:hypothetical protein